ncbi:MAG: hypothetical protein ACQSGP_10820 [Frankia sp.]
MSRPIGRMLGAASLVLGPIAIAASSLASPASGQPGPKTLAKFAAHPGRADVLVAADVLVLFMIPAIALVALLAWRRSPKLATAGGMLGLVAVAASFVLTAFDVWTRVATHAANQAAAGELIRKVSDNAVIGIFGLTFLLGHAIAIGLLGAALWRSRIVARWAAGAVIAYVPLGIISIALPSAAVAVAALFLLVGFTACAALLLRDGVSALNATPAVGTASEGPGASAETSSVLV